MIWRVITLVVWVFCLSSTAFAHTRSQSFSSWEIDGHDAQVIVAVDALRLTQLGALYPQESGLANLFEQHVRETLAVMQDTETCPLTILSPIGDGREVYRLRGTFTCPRPIKDQTTVRAKMFFAVSPTHIHLARIDSGDGQDFVLREGSNTFNLSRKQAPQSLTGFISVGFHHVLSGLDHLIFLVGLALVARHPRTAIICITGFTLGHTAALGVATYGLITPDERIVEALIGFTIAAMALEAGTMLGLPRRRSFIGLAGLAVIVTLLPLGTGAPIWLIGGLLAIYALAMGQVSTIAALRILPAITVAFGLIHGAGFAGGLQELSLSQARIFTPLLGFNIGVELAQLGVLAFIYLGLWLITKLKAINSQWLQHGFSALVFALGCFWFAARVWM